MLLVCDGFAHVNVYLIPRFLILDFRFWLELSHRIEFIPCVRVLHVVTSRVVKSVFESDNFHMCNARWCDSRAWRSMSVNRGPSVGALGVRFDPENQVFRTGHVDFPILGNITYRMVKSDFHDDAICRKCCDQVNSPRFHPWWQIYAEFTVDCCKIYRQISPSFWTNRESTNKHNIVQNVTCNKIKSD